MLLFGKEIVFKLIKLWNSNEDSWRSLTWLAKTIVPLPQEIQHQNNKKFARLGSIGNQQVHSLLLSIPSLFQSNSSKRLQTGPDKTEANLIFWSIQTPVVKLRTILIGHHGLVNHGKSMHLSFHVNIQVVPLTEIQNIKLKTFTKFK